MDMFIDFKEREEGRERERKREGGKEGKRNINVREKHGSVASHTHSDWG